MARSTVLITLVLIAIVGCEHAVDKEKALAAEKERSRSANPGRERGSFQKLSNLMNRTENHREGRRRGKNNLNKILQINREHRAQNDDTLNDNEGAIATKQKMMPDNTTDTLADKMKALRGDGLTYEAVSKYNYVPLVTGVYCNFEPNNNSQVDMCMWQWNTTVSSHGLGFKVVTAADLEVMNGTTRGLKFSGPKKDADGNVTGSGVFFF
ncbi:hypothetical protein RR48_07205 [Papilio machaon]|uniref:Uncharacterized protein n=1 Tax=Papilio machaon TaxID=76193 RepID=A0A194RNX5_PAPMA|nr:hypothetical protein RR48_07205 [Papilio machaon]